MVNLETGSPCTPSPCNNGATCVDLGRRFLCKCPPNFIGATCDTGKAKIVLCLLKIKLSDPLDLLHISFDITTVCCNWRL